MFMIINILTSHRFRCSVNQPKCFSVQQLMHDRREKQSGVEAVGLFFSEILWRNYKQTLEELRAFIFESVGSGVTCIKDNFNFMFSYF